MADKIIDLFTKYGDSDYIGEPVSQIEHMIQSAMIAEENGEDVEMILACLLHDIGHLIEIDNKSKHMDNLGVIDHEIVGKDFLLKCGFGTKIANLVNNHVNAKRYLITNCPDYYENLSPASKQTLIFQKGFMTLKEKIEFESDALFEESIRLRHYDDLAKVENCTIKPLDYYYQMMENYLKLKDNNPQLMKNNPIK